MLKKQFRLIIIFVSGIYMYHACIEPYIPDEQLKFVPRIVVDGLITDEMEEQIIKLSYSSNIDTLVFEPLSGCFVEVFDELGNTYYFAETNPGNYMGTISKDHLVPNRKFQLHFILSNGEEYESDFEKVNPSPPIDSIHYSLDTKETSDPEVTYQGLQFYYDFKAPEEYERYYKLIIEETWEYHATYPITVFYADGFQKVKPDSSLYFCYQTKILNNIFLISTKGSIKNEYMNYRLHFVDNQTQRLKYKYSLLLKQYSISHGAYTFWLNLEKNNQQSGGLYETQPAMVIGNIHHINYPEESVLGYFGVSSVQKKRIFVYKPENFSLIKSYYCLLSKPNIDGWPAGTDPSEWPIYFKYMFDPETESSVLGIAPVECFDCTRSGGNTTKPYFW